MRPRIIILIFLTYPAFSHAQDSLQLPVKYFSQVAQSSKKFNDQINKRSEKALNRLSKQEKKMQAKLFKIDSIAAKNIFTSSLDKIGSLRTSLKNKVVSKLPPAQAGYLDTLQNTLKFLDQPNSVYKSQLANATQSVQELQGKLQQAEQIKAYIQERKQQLKEQLTRYTCFTKNLQNINKEAYYYNEQLKEYKSVYRDPKKAEQKVMATLQKLPAYNDFISRNSQLAGLFNLAGNFNEIRSLEGLQTRNQVDQLLQKQLGSSPDAGAVFNQQMEQVRSQLTTLKDKFPNLDNAAEMPNFQPRELKTKTFLQRLSVSRNLQLQKANSYFPVLADISLQIAYKRNQKSSAGIGISYKLGLGSGISNIAFSHKGAGARSFIDCQLLGNIYINGGLELTRLSGFKKITELKYWSGWQSCALLGISKRYKISPRIKGEMMLLYNFLASQQYPSSKGFKLRTGFTL